MSMFERVLNRMRDLVRGLAYVVTLHAEEEMVEDGYTIYDVENRKTDETVYKP